MKVLITGRNGFIARHLIPRLERDAHQVQSTDRATNVPQLLQDFEPDIIFHLGAELKKEEIMFEVNVGLTMTLIEWCRQSRHTKLILFGSSSEYGRSNKPRAEADCPLPDTIYEGTKAATAMLARAWAQTYKIPITFIRPFTIYGHDEKPNKLTSVLIQKWKDGSVLQLSEGMHDYVYIDDFIDAVLVVTFWNETESFNLVNIGSGQQTSNSDFVRLFQKQLGYVYPVNLVDSGHGYDSMNWVADITVLKSKYGVNVGSLESGLKRLVAEVKKEQEMHQYNKVKDCDS
jgi:nucleoside-diphosphate-sugar epimerase